LTAIFKVMHSCIHVNKKQHFPRYSQAKSWDSVWLNSWGHMSILSQSLYPGDEMSPWLIFIYVFYECIG
jgi:hypothetical protein